MQNTEKEIHVTCLDKWHNFRAHNWPTIKAIHKIMKHTKKNQKLSAPIMGYLKSFRYLGYLGQLMFCLFGGKLCHFKTHDQLLKVFNARPERKEI